jgi:SAM-dependent methyltransferase
VCRVVIDAVTLARTRGFNVFLDRLRSPRAWRHLLYGWTQIRDRRSALGRRYLAGSGLEIGALHKPQAVSLGAHVTYVDHLDQAGLRAEYPELNRVRLVDVDILDDAETLTSVAAQSQDFIIANHYLEHCENPLGAIRSHLEKVKTGGLLFYTLPDRNMTFDWKRHNTPFAHLVADDERGPEQSRVDHYRDWVRHVVGKEGAAVEATSRRLMTRHYSIHFHCWDKPSLRAFFVAARAYLDEQFSIVECRPNGPEMVFVLRRSG